MTARGGRWLFLIAAVLLTAYAVVFPLLTIDTLIRIFGRASVLETRSLFLILYLELSRLVTSLTAITIAIVLMVRGSQRAEARSLALFLLFTTITYEKVFGTNGFPGRVQEHVAESLFAAGASPKLLLWLFGPIAWAAWPAAAALLRFSAVFPKPLEAETLEASGREDRRGFMRSTGVAGADIGALFRRTSKRLLSLTAFRPLTLGVAAVILIIGHTLLAGSRYSAVLWLVVFLVLCIVVTNIRAAYVASTGADRVRIIWIAEGFVLALFMFLESAAILLILPGAVPQMMAFLLIMLIPATVMVCMALSVLDRGELDSKDAIDRTVRNGTVVLAVTIVFGALYLLLTLATDRLGISHALAALAAVAAAAFGFEPVKRTTDRFRLALLERDRGD